ncbi:MAG: PadR family transcriptional regulator [Luteitalea sp.]|nr:PadR family transcriptional regulator [Luteitalea sp.]
MKKASLDVVRGTLDVLILRALSWGPQHGYAVSQWIRDRTKEELLVEEGALYPALYRMETKGWIRAEWRVSENNRRAKYYTLTAEGRRHLRQESATWRRYTLAVSRILSATTGPGLRRA